ncbi:hypothetical protein [Flavobacterium sp. F52]|uniref:hypothetical protein n=1 Tax=Flavobacterium sp. F52 TaxID=1202532 RepID=UPI000272DFD2|nr:hypothetical protein [Flavobacterium sp. F52]EJG02282.1 hypothetical protein FF52_06365 [Flavobacterium sp. F52]
MDIVKKWFNNGCDYSTGLIIYASIPKHNKLLLKNLQKKHNSFNTEKLKYELKKFLEKYVEDSFSDRIKTEVASIVNPIQKEELKTEQKTALLFHQLPEELRPVLLEASSLFKENCMYKVALNELPQHAEKESIALQLKIHSNIKKNALCWSRIDFFLENRIIADAPKNEFEQLTPAGLIKRQQLLYASISKLKSRINCNKEILKSEETVATRSKIERQILKQEENLLNQEENLLAISNLIDGK